MSDGESISDLLLSKDFPCVFAKNSYKKNLLTVININLKEVKKNEEIYVLTKIMSENLIKYCRSYSEKSTLDKRFSTIVFVIENHFVNEKTEFILSIIRGLYEIDKSDWPEQKTQTIDDNDFEFYHDGKAWFPILFCKKHPSKLREYKSTVIAFQPMETFYINKTIYSCPYEKIRRYIHVRIGKFYKGNTPYYMSEKSEGKNITQYIGYDITEIDKNYKFGSIDETVN